MEDKSEIKKEFTEYDQTCIEGHLSPSVGLKNFKNEPKEDHPAIEVKVEKGEVAEYDQRALHNLSTSIDLTHFKNEPKGDHPAMEVKVENEEVAEFDQKDIDNLSTSIDLKDLKDEPEENQQGKTRSQINKSSSN
uniref:Uncharacterized protein LOC114343407 n=1 Tax=Diabrotica virgifera virgifera TaxID=50390 RepID=A0A6P7GX83_DIAVI